MKGKIQSSLYSRDVLTPLTRWDLWGLQSTSMYFEIFSPPYPLGTQTIVFSALCDLGGMFDLRPLVVLSSACRSSPLPKCRFIVIVSPSLGGPSLYISRASSLCSPLSAELSHIVELPKLSSTLISASSMQQDHQSIRVPSHSHTLKTAITWKLDSHRVQLSLLSGITFLCCLESNIWKQLHLIFSPRFIIF